MDWRRLTLKKLINKLLTLWKVAMKPLNVVMWFTQHGKKTKIFGQTWSALIRQLFHPTCSLTIPCSLTKARRQKKMVHCIKVVQETQQKTYLPPKGRYVFFYMEKRYHGFHDRFKARINRNFCRKQRWKRKCGWPVFPLPASHGAQTMFWNRNPDRIPETGVFSPVRRRGKHAAGCKSRGRSL